LSIETDERICPLCRCKKGQDFFQDDRDYFRCPACSLVFVPPRCFLTTAEEKAVYDCHENRPDDPGYRRFLSRLFDPMNERLKPGSHGLDFGSGPGPTLSLMFEETGHTVNIYDPLYAPDPRVLDLQYDFITTSEVVEHLRQPQKELDHLWNCLKPRGWLGVMTKRVIDRKAFSTWHYKGDPTHVCFFSVATFQWLATQWRARLLVVDKDVVLFEKTPEIDFQSGIPLENGDQLGVGRVIE